MAKKEMIKEWLVTWAKEALEHSSTKDGRRIVIMKKSAVNMAFLAYTNKKGYTESASLNDNEVVIVIKKHFVAKIRKAAN